MAIYALGVGTTAINANASLPDGSVLVWNASLGAFVPVLVPPPAATTHEGPTAAAKLFLSQTGN